MSGRRKTEKQVEEVQARTSLDPDEECPIASKQNGRSWNTQEETEKH